MGEDHTCFTLPCFCGWVHVGLGPWEQICLRQTGWDPLRVRGFSADDKDTYE